ncbi:MAG: 5'-nucleotidase C-terminal domain-containing protein, partial [Gemmatimonadetes bacterium]|nr:5'-nucleotidase C-terminal domain-containing protein [Gemmatimonadota bacterium]
MPPLTAALALSLAMALAAAPAALPAQPRRTEVVILATTDVHGRLRGWDYVANRPDPARSLAGAATIVDSVRRAHPGRVVLVDAGDLLQGNPLTFVAARVAPTPVHPVMAAMNAMRYDAAVLGNHEFNYGVPLLQRALGQAGFPFLAANLRDARGRLWVPPSTLVERAGIRVGIVGGTTPGSMIWDQANLAAAGLTVGDIVPAVRAEAAALRRRGAHVVVALLHAGLEEPSSYDTVATGLPSENVAARVAREAAVDLVVYGHSHREMVDTTIGGALLVQPRNWAASVAAATLTLEKRGRRWAVVEKRGSAVRVAGHAEHPDVLAATARTHAAAVAWATAPVARATVAWRGDSARVADVPLTDFVAEVMRRETGADLAATAAFSLDAGFAAGPVTLADFARLYPYDNTLRAVRITGAQLRAFLEHAARYYRTLGPGDAVPPGGIVDAQVPGYNFDVVSGAEYTLDLRRPVGARVTRLAVRGRAVQDTDQFTLAVNNYRQGGGGGFAMLAGAPVVYNKDVDIRQLLIDEARRVGTLDLAAYAARNWTLEPAAAVAAAYREQRRGAAAEASGRAPAAAPAEAAPAGAAVAGRTVRVIAMSDFHATLSPRAEGSGRLAGGAVALSAAIERARRECTGACQSVVVDAGDLFTGSPASDWDAGRPTVAVLNRFHVAAGALGNHEFDFGQDTLRQRVSELAYRVLGANVLGPDGTRPAWLRADTVVERGGVRIGIVGAAGTHTPNTTKLRNVRGLRFADPAPVISERVRALRAAGAQVVIAVIHDGARCERDRPDACQGEGLEVARRLTDRPDLYVMGHAHVNLTTTVNGMPVVEPNANGRAIVVVDLPLDGGAAAVAVRPVDGAMVDGADPVV